MIRRMETEMKLQLLITILISLCFLFLAFSCAQEERYTRAEWERIYKPQTMQEAEAMAALETARKEAEGKLESQRRMDTFKMACAAGVVASIFALTIGAWLKLSMITAIASAGLIASGAGFGFAVAAFSYAKYFAYGGLALGAVVGGYALFIIIKGFMEVVNTVKRAKEVNPSIKDTLKDLKKDVGIQSSVTEKIVENVTGK